jgi:hypothetical protein
MKELEDFAKLQPEFEAPDLPGGEYENLGLFIGNFLACLRVSMGDFDFGGAGMLTVEENILFFVLWAIIVLVTCIVFLNFIIAEASESYARVKE